MVGEGVEKKLYDAASRGDLPTFQQLLQGDPYLLDGVSFAGSRNLLHIATIWGQFSIVKEILKIHKQLAKQLDSQKSSPLHIAAAEGYVVIASELLLAAPNMCWSRDCHGMNPIHIAAMNGYVEILEVLILLVRFPAMEKVDRGLSVLHLCVKHGQLKALEVLVESLGELVWAEDDQGDTILHFAVRCNQIEIIRYLVEENKIAKTKMNYKGKRAVDILKAIDPSKHNYFLRNHKNPPVSVHIVVENTMPPLHEEVQGDRNGDWGPNRYHGIPGCGQPPGGVWQDDSSSHRAGAAVMAYTHPQIYKHKHFGRANMVAFILSIILIFLLTTGLSSMHLLVTIIVMHSMFVSLASIAVSYGASVMMITPNTQTQSFGYVIGTVVAVTVTIIGSFWLRAFYLAVEMEKRFN